MKKVILPLLAILLVTLLASCDGFIAPSIKAEASTQSTASAPTPAPTVTPLPGFTKTLAVGESVTATNGIDRAIEIKYEGTITDTYICNDGTMVTCATSLANDEFDFVIDGIKIGHAKGATIEIFQGWGETLH